jgi:chromosome segregation ATPase
LAKIAVSIPDSTLARIDELSTAKGITRSRYVSMALDFYSNGASNLQIDNDKLNNKLIEKAKEIDSLSSEVLALKEQIHTLENTLSETGKESETKALEVFQRDKRIHTLENTVAEKDKKLESISTEILRLKDESMKSLEDIGNMKREKEKLEVALNAKDDEVGFLRRHVAQLTQSISQLALPQMTERASRTKETLVADLEMRNCIGSKCY